MDLEEAAAVEHIEFAGRRVAAVACLDGNRVAAEVPGRVPFHGSQVEAAMVVLVLVAAFRGSLADPPLQLPRVRLCVGEPSRYNVCV